MAKTILTEKLIEQAIELAKPSVESILSQGIGTWGPRCVSVVVNDPIKSEIFHFKVGVHEEWKDEWGKEKDFYPIASKKQALSQRTGMPTSVVVSKYPYLLEEGDFLYSGGYAETPGGLSVGVSGALGVADEEIAKIIFTTITLLCKLKTKEMQDNDINCLE